MKKKNKEVKAIDMVVNQPPIIFPYHVRRFFTEGSRQIDFSGDQVSFGEDFGTVDELRGVIEWFADQFDGKVKWK